VHKEAETENRQIKAFYHSHPNHDAYFSEKDKADAMAWDEPMYPEAAYIVISIYAQEIRVTRAYAWSETAADFVEIPIKEK
jgi:proteasome lid subunit RPN8/RPN11